MHLTVNKIDNKQPKASPQKVFDGNGLYGFAHHTEIKTGWWATTLHSI